MNPPDLHWIARQYHTGKMPEEMDMGTVEMDLGKRLQLVDQAIQAFSTEASLWAGSNEVVLPGWDTPHNIVPFNRFKPAAPMMPPDATRAGRTSSSRPPRRKTADKAPLLKVHWRLKISFRRYKQRLYLDLLWREESLQNAYQDFLDGAGDWAAVERVHLEYIDTIRDANTFINAVWDDQEEYYWTRSKPWQNSDSAWAYQAWMEAWEKEIPSPSLPPRAGNANLNLGAAKTLRAIPDEPAD
jgi:hypothetical protein